MVARLRHPIGLILAMHVALGLGFGLATPIFEAPDEENHYLFVRYLQIHRALPIQTLDPSGPRGHHPPLYHLLAALASAWVEVEGGAERVAMTVNPHVTFRYGDPDIRNKALYVHHTPEERWPYRGQALAVHVMRLVSVAFSAIAVWCIYHAALELRPGDETFALFSAALLGFNAMVLFMSGVVQNSTAALASGIAILYALSRAVRRGLTVKRWLVVGMVFAISLLLQISALTLAAPIGLTLLAEAWRARSLRPLAVGAAAVTLPVTAITGWWFARNQLLYGDWTANSTIAALWTYGPIMPLTQALFLVGTGLVGRFGQGLMVDFPGWVYAVVGVCALVALAGGGKVAWRFVSAQSGAGGWAARLDALTTPDVFLWVLHFTTIIAVAVALIIYMYGYIHGLHGRYAFTLFPSCLLILAGGWLAWFPRQRSRMAVLTGLAALLLPVYGLFGLLIPTYAPPRAPSPAELRQAQPLDAAIGGVARVLGHQSFPSRVKAGEVLEITVYWQPLARTDRPYTVFVHLVHPEVGSLAQVDLFPGAGNWATTVWDVDRAFVDVYRLQLPQTAEPLQDAFIVLGLYDLGTMQRLPVTGADAGSPDEAWVQFGRVTIEP